MAIVHLPEFRIGPNAAIGAPLDEMLAAYDILRGLPTARLERLFAEHVDTLSYRIDAWETALIDRRLRRRRAASPQGGESQRGLYLGAVGYLEGVRRSAGRRRQIEESVLTPAMREGRGDLYEPVDGAGFVHTPSLNHATAGAILRNGYLTHATPEDPGRLAVNLEFATRAPREGAHGRRAQRPASRGAGRHRVRARTARRDDTYGGSDRAQRPEAAVSRSLPDPTNAHSKGGPR